MAVPKRRMSRANTRARRSQWKANNAALQNVTIDGHTYRIPRRLVRAARMGLVWKSSSSNTRHGYLIFRGSQCFCCRLLKFLRRRFLLVTGRLRENTGTFRGVNTANSQQDKAQWWL